MKRLILAATGLALAGCGNPPAREAAAANETEIGDVANPAGETSAPAEGAAGTAAADAAAGDGAGAAPGAFKPWQSTAILSATGLSAAQPDGAKRLTVGFGAARGVAEAALTAGSGLALAARGRNEECGAGPIDSTGYPGGLWLDFQNGKFVGWHLGESDGPRWATRDGPIGIGTRQSELDDARVFDSTLGEEFTAGGVSGILEDDRVVALWAGVSCNFR